MEKNGFTLVELLITIAIIGILGAISVGLIMNSVSGAKSDLDEYQKGILIGTAKLYIDDNELSIGTDSKYHICIHKDLVLTNYLSGDYKDSKGNILYGAIVLDSNGKLDSITTSTNNNIETNCYN